MYRRFTLLALAITIISGVSRIAMAQVKGEFSKMRNFSGEPNSLAIYTPVPEYSYEARERRMTGSGIVLLNIDLPTGRVTSARMLKSTGYQILDESALSAFRQWRFRPGTVSKVRIPVRFTMNGAHRVIYPGLLMPAQSRGSSF
jgi:TonB family protein